MHASNFKLHALISSNSALGIDSLGLYLSEESFGKFSSTVMQKKNTLGRMKYITFFINQDYCYFNSCETHHGIILTLEPVCELIRSALFDVFTSPAKKPSLETPPIMNKFPLLSRFIVGLALPIDKL